MVYEESSFYFIKTAVRRLNHVIYASSSKQPSETTKGSLAAQLSSHVVDNLHLTGSEGLPTKGIPYLLFSGICPVVLIEPSGRFLTMQKKAWVLWNLVYSGLFKGKTQSDSCWSWSASTVAAEPPEQIADRLPVYAASVRPACEFRGPCHTCTTLYRGLCNPTLLATAMIRRNYNVIGSERWDNFLLGQ